MGRDGNPMQSGQASLASVQPGMLPSGPGHCREQGQVPGKQKGPQGRTAVKMLSVGGGAWGEGNGPRTLDEVSRECTKISTLGSPRAANDPDSGH